LQRLPNAGSRAAGSTELETMIVTKYRVAYHD
jgi:hypothetical protein